MRCLTRHSAGRDRPWLRPLRARDNSGPLVRQRNGASRSVVGRLRQRLTSASPEPVRGEGGVQHGMQAVATLARAERDHLTVAADGAAALGRTAR
jgi:hypothetical protein